MTRLIGGGETVGYESEDKKLIVTITEQIALKMKADGWNTHYEEEVGHFVVISLAG